MKLRDIYETCNEYDTIRIVCNGKILYSDMGYNLLNMAYCFDCEVVGSYMVNRLKVYEIK